MCRRQSGDYIWFLAFVDEQLAMVHDQEESWAGAAGNRQCSCSSMRRQVTGWAALSARRPFYTFWSTARVQGLGAGLFLQMFTATRITRTGVCMCPCLFSTTVSTCMFDQMLATAKVAAIPSF